MSLDVAFLPTLVNAKDLADRTVVVIDVLRATTTITQAIVAGATEVIPCVEVVDALQIATTFTTKFVLGGERGGKRIDGFDLGNSPAEYTPQAVGGGTLIFTTTNGTRAMQMCQQAKQVLLGSFNNLSSLVSRLRKASNITLLCAGTAGRITREDVLFAGALMHHLGEDAAKLHPWNDEALLAAAAYAEIAGREAEVLMEQLLESRGGRNLARLGMKDDVQFAAQIDTTSIVAELRLPEMRIRKTVI